MEKYIHICDCGKTLNAKGRCDGSHSLSDVAYAEMKIRMLKRLESRKQRRENRTKNNDTTDFG
jgi:CDGSH-type Zn-finger protein